MHRLYILLALVIGGVNAQAQTVEVTVTTDPKKVERILTKEREAGNANRAYFEEDERCRNLLKSKLWGAAELSCRKAIGFVDKLPKEHALSKSSARKYLGISLIWQQRYAEGIELLNQSLELGKPVIDDTDSETGEIYILLGQTYHAIGNVASARGFYERAEKTYRTAFREIDDDELRTVYSRTIKNIVNSHRELLRSAEMEAEAKSMQSRLDDVEKEFGKYLNE